MKKESIARNLIYLRKSKGSTQEELSQKTEVTVRTIQRIEKGDVQPHLHTIKVLAAALEVNVEDLLPLDNPKEEAIQKKWLLLMHATPILGLALPLCNVLFPLFLWIHKREDNPLYDRHGIQVINFQITVLLLYILSFIALLTIEKWGFIMFVTVIPVSLLIVVANIIYAIKTYKCYYPLAIPFLGFKAGGLKMVLPMLLLVSFASCADSKTHYIERLDNSMIAEDSISAKIKQLMTTSNVPGLAISVYNNSQVAYQRTFGFKDYSQKTQLNDSSNIYGASLSKAVFSVLVMDLVEEGILNLDTPLESYLPRKIDEYVPQTRWHDDYSALKEDRLYHKITARMCLAHTSGFANWRFDEPDEKLRVRDEPGTIHRYSGEGFVYLQVVLEKMTGKGLQQLAEERIFKPLGMEDSAYEWKPRFERNFAYGHSEEASPYAKDKDNEPRAASTLETTAADYSKFLQAVLNGRLLTEASYKELFSPQIQVLAPTSTYPVKNRDRLFENLKVSYALGWGFLETPHGKAVFKGGNGSGFQHYSILFPERGMGVLIMTNSRNGRSIFMELLEVVLRDRFTTLEVAATEHLFQKPVLC